MGEKEFEALLDDNGYERLRIKLKNEKGLLTDVVFQFESFINNKWHPIVRYDCAHGYFHRDIMMPNGQKEKQSLEFDNLKDAAKYAEQDIRDRWDWYKERYMRKIKNK